MGIYCRWDNPQKTVLYIVFEKGWAWADYVRAQDEIDALLSGVMGQVHVIVDMRGAQAFPGSTILSDIMHEIATAPDRPGMLVIVGASHVLQLFFRTMQRLTPSLLGKHIRFADNPEEARGILRTVTNLRQSLRDQAIVADISDNH
ncbi:MAG: hypothetical protein U0694_10240 [Anaerolineae bacterium]